jgi:hypothetical protein
MALARLRTVTQTIELYRQLDPDSCISEYWLRRYIKLHPEVIVKSGVKQLINLEKFEEALNNGTEIEEQPQARIRAVK